VYQPEQPMWQLFDGRARLLSCEFICLKTKWLLSTLPFNAKSFLGLPFSASVITSSMTIGLAEGCDVLLLYTVETTYQ
jgi:hypothetical protein